MVMFLLLTTMFKPIEPPLILFSLIVMKIKMMLLTDVNYLSVILELKMNIELTTAQDTLKPIV
jgi:hypothetical protein